jgi:hypothetical protein
MKGDIAAKQVKLNGEKEKLRTLRKGSGEKVVTGVDPTTGKPTTRAMSSADIGKKLKLIKSDGTIVNDVEVNQNMFDGSRGLDKMQKNLENIKVARMKEYHHSLMKNTGIEVKGATRDELGNFKDIGHMAHETTKETGRRIGREFARNWKQNLGKGLAAGAAGAFVAGPFGAAGGFFAGSLGNSLKEIVLPQIGNLDHDVAHHVTSTEKHDHEHYKDTYKSPSSDFFGIFKGLGSSGGGGESHGGGGHDSHGGEHH